MRFRKPDSEMEQLRRRIDAWRRTRSGRCPMPEALWLQAALLVPNRSLSKVATSLGLGYYSLQERARRPVPSSAASGFVELSGAQLVASTPSSATGTVIEVRKPDGSLLTLRLAPGTIWDVADLVRRFRAGTS
jgi:hypothetical protein